MPKLWKKRQRPKQNRQSEKPLRERSRRFLSGNARNESRNLNDGRSGKRQRRLSVKRSLRPSNVPNQPRQISQNSRNVLAATSQRKRSKSRHKRRPSSMSANALKKSQKRAKAALFKT
jgi:hypothetical protein